MRDTFNGHRKRAPTAAGANRRIALLLGAALLFAGGAAQAADSAAKLASDSQSALNKLYARIPAAKALGEQAYAVLVFPKVTKAGLVIGGQYGDGALIQGGKVVGYYNTSGASYGLQAGVQQFGYAMMFMNEAALGQINAASGFEVGVGPSVVVVDDGMAKTLTTKTIDKDIYAFIFSQKGLMAGLGLQGTKITRINPK